MFTTKHAVVPPTCPPQGLGADGKRQGIHGEILKTMGKWWYSEGYHGNIMGISWEYHGILLEYMDGNLMECEW